MNDNRITEAAILITDEKGNPLANRPVQICQLSHKFLFGCNVFNLNKLDSPEKNRAYADRFASLLNYATLPFYWGGYEPGKGQPQPASRHQMVEWCLRNSIVPKGHPLCWHEVLPKWLPQRGGSELLDLQKQRIRRDVAEFGGMVKWWDVVNEACVMPRYQLKTNPMARLCKRLGRIALIRITFDEARKSDPSAGLILNDYEVSDRYEKLIEACLEAGTKIDAIGIQSHMHVGWWGEEKILDVCNRFARFGLPLHFTELTILSGAPKKDNDWHSFHPGWDSTPAGEERQRREVESTYRILFGHPAVHAITWWDFSDAGAWQGAPAGLLRKDMSPKPAYDTLLGFIRGEWWSGKQNLASDAAGRFRFKAFLGSYRLETKDGFRSEFKLERTGRISLSIRLERDA